MTIVRSVPVDASTGLEGWTSCCGAAVTFHDETLICKGCHWDVYTDVVEGERGVRLGRIVADVIAGTLPATEGVLRQRALIGR